MSQKKKGEINEKVADSSWGGGANGRDINKVKGKCERRWEWIDCCPAAQETIMEQQRS